MKKIMQTPSPPELEPHDVLNGGAQIHSFVVELLGRDHSLSATYYWIAKGWIPATKVGNHLIASRRAIRQHLAVAAGIKA
jgi:hypothetical protein